MSQRLRPAAGGSPRFSSAALGKVLPFPRITHGSKGKIPRNCHKTNRFRKGTRAGLRRAPLPLSSCSFPTRLGGTCSQRVSSRGRARCHRYARSDTLALPRLCSLRRACARSDMCVLTPMCSCSPPTRLHARPDALAHSPRRACTLAPTRWHPCSPPRCHTPLGTRGSPPPSPHHPRAPPGAPHLRARSRRTGAVGALRGAWRDSHRGGTGTGLVRSAGNTREGPGGWGGSPCTPGWGRSEQSVRTGLGPVGFSKISVTGAIGLSVHTGTGSGSGSPCAPGWIRSGSPCAPGWLRFGLSKNTGPGSALGSPCAPVLLTQDPRCAPAAPRAGAL